MKTKLSLLLLIFLGTACTNTEKAPPNIVLIFVDDLGYADLGIYGSEKIATPVLDQMARKGVYFTDFYVTASICSPSRASLLTGQYPSRNGVTGVYFPEAVGMRPEVITIAEVLKPQGYRTACFGKWHLGDMPETLPLNQGFDEYFGIPYSNDMYIGPQHEFADSVHFRLGYNLEKAKADQLFVKEHKKERKKIKEQGIKELVPLFEGNKIIEYPCDQASLTRRYIDRTINFIEASEGQPFFVYLTPAMPHVPLFVSDEHAGNSQAGLYGDVVEEIDANVGRLLQFLERKNLDENTMLIFISDNGPWLGYGEHAGKATPLRDGKFSNYEGGVRVPSIMYWPGTWKAGQVRSGITSTLDILPTLAHYAKVDLPTAQIDGQNISEPLEKASVPMPEAVIFYTKNDEMYGVRKGDWKYLPYSGARHANPDSLPQLFNLRQDISETTNVIDTYPDVVKELEGLIDSFK